MIITRTPLRISLVGGGTDMPSFYSKHGGGVVSLAINRFVYICANEKFDGNFRLSYSQTENVHKAKMIKHDLARACLLKFPAKGLEITSIGDIPGEGTGLGSSSSFTVGLLLALSEMYEPHWSPKTLAEDAYLVESGCGHVLGKQDQYAAAYGGFHFFRFLQDGSVCCEPLCTDDEQKKYINDRLMLFWTGRTRRSGDILRTQDLNLTYNAPAIDAALQMRDLAETVRLDVRKGNLGSLGDSLKTGWELKKHFSPSISDPAIDRVYARGMRAGASGGKLCGAGGGGFLLLWVEPEHQEAVRKSVHLRQVPVSIEDKGSSVIYHG